MSGTPPERVSEYLGSLPEGIRSYPDCLAVGSLVTTCLAVRPLEASSALPERLQELVAAPPLASQWISEVEYCALNLAIADAYAMDEAAFRQFWYETMARLTESPLYRFFFSFITPERALRGASMRWSKFHQGTQLRSHAVGEETHYELSWRPGLVPALIAEGYAGVFHRFVELSRVKSATVERSSFGPTGARYRIRYGDAAESLRAAR